MHGDGGETEAGSIGWNSWTSNRRSAPSCAAIRAWASSWMRTLMPCRSTRSDKSA